MRPPTRPARRRSRPGPGRRRWTALALASVLALGLLPACGGDDDGVPVLNWYINPDNGGQAQLAERCTDAADGAYRIEVSTLPNNASQQREQLVRRLAAKDSSVDLMSLDPPFVAEFANAGFLEPIDATTAAEITADAFDSTIASGTWDDTLYAAPFWANTQLLWYRTDVAEAAGLDMTQPVTWEQVVDAAVAEGKRVDVQGARYEGYMVWINALIESAGGHVLSNPEAGRDVEVTIDTDEGRRAAEIIRLVARSAAANDQLSTAQEPQALNSFLSERAGFMINWPYVYAASRDALAPEDFENIGWARYPQVDAGTESRPPLGGINLAIGAFGDHRDLALDAIRCLTTLESSIFYFVGDGTDDGYGGSGNPSAFSAAYDDPLVQEQYPMADLIRESIDASAPRPITPFYGDVSAAVQREFHPPGAVDPDSTPRRAQQLVRDVIDDRRLL